MAKTAAPETLTVLVPCLNEEHNLPETVADILATAPGLPVKVEILLIDDGSTDGTRGVMERLCAAHPEVSMRVNAENLGLGRSVMQAYETIPDGHWVTVIPGDNEYIFASIRNLLAVRGDADLVLGYFQNPVIRTATRRLASRSFTLVMGALYGFSWRYLNGMKLYRVEVMRGLSVRSGGHAYTAELIAKAQLRNPMLRIREAPFAARGRAAGQTKAFRPAGISRAVREAWVGYRSVQRYRTQLLEEAGGDGSSATPSGE
ncbi:MAG: glycosyltransferase family 2 protein [Alphaproteobacteria bacterium]|nr:glycosyltransferase family 2 protein [Alphaproteobacteria bacterium]